MTNSFWLTDLTVNICGYPAVQSLNNPDILPFKVPKKKKTLLVET